MVKEQSQTTRNEFPHHLVKEIQGSCAPRQRAVISVVAICQKHGIAPEALLKSFAADLPRTPLEPRRRTGKFYWSRVEQLAETCSAHPSIQAAISASPGILPDAVAYAMLQEQQFGNSSEFNQAWLNRTQDVAFDSDPQESVIARVFPLIAKTLIIFGLALFILLWIFPEFMEMTEEFGITPPAILSFTSNVVETFLNLLWVPALALLLAIPLSFPSVRKFFRLWNPFNWRQPIIPQPIINRRALALTLQYGQTNLGRSSNQFRKLARSLETPASDEASSARQSEIDWQRLVSQSVLSKTEGDAMQQTDSDESRAWILQRTATYHHRRIESRGAFVSRAIIYAIQIILAGIVILFALSIITTLVTLITHMQ